MSHVYAISDGSAIKFGVAVNPLSRMFDLQVGSSARLGLAFSISCGQRAAAFILERMIHDYLRDELVRGEWFYGQRTVAMVGMFGDTLLPPVPPPDRKRLPVVPANSGNGSSARVQAWRQRNREHYRAYAREYMRRLRAAKKSEAV